MSEERERNPRGNTVLLTVIAVATLLVAVIGATFAFFTVNITGNDSATSFIIKTATLGIVFTSGNTITLDNLMPGDPRIYDSGDDNYQAPKVFTVKNTSTVDMKYNIVWQGVINEFTTVISLADDLTYGVASSSDTGDNTPPTVTAPTAMPANGNSTMLSTITISPQETHTYTLTLEFLNTSSNQNIHQGKNFIGVVNIELVP